MSKESKERFLKAGTYNTVTHFLPTLDNYHGFGDT